VHTVHHTSIWLYHDLRILSASPTLKSLDIRFPFAWYYIALHDVASLQRRVQYFFPPMLLIHVFVWCGCSTHWNSAGTRFCEFGPRIKPDITCEEGEISSTSERWDTVFGFDMFCREELNLLTSPINPDPDEPRWSVKPNAWASPNRLMSLQPGIEMSVTLVDIRFHLGRGEAPFVAL